MLVQNPTMQFVNSNSKLDNKQMRLLQEVMKLSSSHSNNNSFLCDMREDKEILDFNVPASIISSSSKKNMEPTISYDYSHLASTSTKSNNNKKGKRTPSPKQKIIEPSSTTADIHFSGSAYENAPDASELPLPDFDEDLPSFFDLDQTSYSTKNIIITSSEKKTNALRQFLKVRKV